MITINMEPDAEETELSREKLREEVEVNPKVHRVDPMEMLRSLMIIIPMDIILRTWARLLIRNTSCSRSWGGDIFRRCGWLLSCLTSSYMHSKYRRVRTSILNLDLKKKKFYMRLRQTTKIQNGRSFYRNSTMIQILKLPETTRTICRCSIRSSIMHKMESISLWHLKCSGRTYSL